MHIPTYWERATSTIVPQIVYVQSRRARDGNSNVPYYVCSSHHASRTLRTTTKQSRPGRFVNYWTQKVFISLDSSFSIKYGHKINITIENSNKKPREREYSGGWTSNSTKTDKVTTAQNHTVSNLIWAIDIKLNDREKHWTLRRPPRCSHENLRSLTM